MHWSTDALKKNRVSAIVYGGSESDRRAFAEAAVGSLEGAGLIEAKDAGALERSLGNARAVIYVPDLGAIPAATQRTVVRVLREKEERPKVVFGLGTSPDTAFEKGALTEDLKFWLGRSTVDVKARGSRK